MKRLLFSCLLLLAACELSASPATLPPATVPLTQSVTAAPATDQPCAYMQAYQDLPDLSAQVDQSIQALQPDARGRAQAYGENCVSASGQSTFSAQETDFYVTLNVQNLSDSEELGNWITRVMTALAAYPSANLPGPQTGFVEFTFKNATDQRVLRVSIDQYNQLPPGLSGAQIIQSLFPSP